MTITSTSTSPQTQGTRSVKSGPNSPLQMFGTNTEYDHRSCHQLNKMAIIGNRTDNNKFDSYHFKLDT